jgi:hypothetical protein
LKRSSDFKHRHHLSTREASNASSVNGDIVSQERRVLDSEALFEADVTRVIQELRPWPQDPSVPAYFAGSKLSFTNYWSLDDWERHNSRWRFFRYARGFPTSRLLRRIAPQLAGLFVWSLLAVALHSRFIVFSRVRVPLSALSMISTFVAALLTLRTNQGLDRLIMGRNSLGNMVFFSRDAAMLFSTYIYPKDEQLGLKAGMVLFCLIRSVSLFCFLLSHAWFFSTPSFPIWLGITFPYTRYFPNWCYSRHPPCSKHECLVQICNSTTKSPSSSPVYAATNCMRNI